MKKLLLTFILLATASFAQTRNLVPKASGEGSIGATNSQWDALYVGSLYLNGQSIDNYLPTNAGVTSINGLLGDVGFEAGRGFMSSNVGPTIYLNLMTNDFVVGTNIATYRYTGGEQYFQVPATVPNMKAWLWGGAGGGGAGAGGAGGYTEVSFPVLPFEILTVVVGGSGSTVTGTVASPVRTDRTYPDGGWAVSAGARAGAGGGRSQILRGSLSITNESRTVAVAAGGGGGADSTRVGVPGGGDIGVDGTASAAQARLGGGARSLYSISSTNVNIYTNDSVVTTSFVYNIGFTGYVGGTTISAGGAQIIFTNTAGAQWSGGNAGLATTNHAGYAGGGGGGYYGGGGALSSNSAANASGGSGIGWINTNLGAFGRTIRGVTTTPAGSENTYYISGTAVGVANTNTGNGLIILQY